MTQAQAHLPVMRLLCFPFSGGSAVSYRGLGTSFDSIEVTTFELPGRGRRFSEPLLHAIEPMVDDLFRQVLPLLRAPYALFGHSMGGLLAYLVARRARREGLAAPAALIVSGSRAPSRISNNGSHDLPRPEFHRMLAALGGCPPDILAHPELMALYEPVLRADFRAIAEYRHRPGEPFEFPITTCVATEDQLSGGAGDWQCETVLPLRAHVFRGGHFFIFRHWAEIQQIVSEQLWAGAADRHMQSPQAVVDLGAS